MAIACCGADLMPLRWVSTPTQGGITFASSAPVTTAITPGAFLPAAVAIVSMRAWAWGERTKATCGMRGSVTSLTNWARPWGRRAGGGGREVGGRPGAGDIGVGRGGGGENGRGIVGNLHHPMPVGIRGAQRFCPALACATASLASMMAWYPVQRQ